ncbi:MAG TPA: hypothetical protein VGX70_00250 [Gemmataceae bacterium]|jgi:hypothetical protein|nr:hypothetical protein [Gemmataceae bacterium]
MMKGLCGTLSFFILRSSFIIHRSSFVSAKHQKALLGPWFGFERCWSNVLTSAGRTPFESIPIQRVDARRGLTAAAFARTVDGLGLVFWHQLHGLLLRFSVYVYYDKLVTLEMNGNALGDFGILNAIPHRRFNTPSALELAQFFIG